MGVDVAVKLTAPSDFSFRHALGTIQLCTAAVKYNNMIKNNFKIATRSLWENKAYSAINIIGLTIGLAGLVLI
jgi:hypothetical protein